MYGGNLQQMSTFRFHFNKQAQFTYAAAPPPFFAAASIVACTHAEESPCRADPLQPKVELSTRDVGVNHVGLRNRVAGVMPLSGTTPEVAGKSRPIMQQMLV
jgi:7-keto-8-aminopelargonate synthetase-like enzyme